MTIGAAIAVDAVRSDQVRGWIEVDARLDPASARIDEVSVRRNGTPSTSYVPKVDYEYTVGGVDFANDDVFVPERRFRDRQEARDVLDELTATTDVAVLVDPDAPGDATLLRNPADVGWRFAGLAAIAVGVPSVFWLSGRWAGRRTSRYRRPTLR